MRHLQEGVAEVNREARTNYRLYWEKLNAASYGVPQLRDRVFIVASRDGRPFAFPGSTHGPADSIDLLAARVEPYRTAWDAIGDLPARPNDPSNKVCGKWADLLPTIPEGENYLWHTSRGGGEPLFGWRTRFWSFLLKLKKDQPSWTIQAQPGPATGPFHWCNRRLTAHELCRLQTFPDGLTLECGQNAIQKLLGNAVPSLLAEVLARTIRERLLDNPCLDSDLRLMPPVRTPVPPAEPVTTLPRKYRQYIGHHADHPGEGLGARARLRTSTTRSQVPAHAKV